MYKDTFDSWFTLVVLGGTLLITSCANRYPEITVSQEEIKKEVAKLEKLKNAGELKSKLQQEYENDFELLDVISYKISISTAYDKASDNREAELKKLRMILEKDNPALERLAESIIRIRKAKKICEREYRRVFPVSDT